MRRLILAVLAGGMIASPAFAEDPIVRTPSGKPELLLPGRDRIDAAAQLAHVCEQLDWNVLPRTSKNSLSCAVPTKEFASVQVVRSEKLLDLGNWAQLPVHKMIRFSFDETERGVVVRASAERLTPHPRDVGRFNREAIDDQNTFNGLLNIIALVGDVELVPGTTVAKLGYLGFRSDRHAAIELDGKDRTAVQVGVVEGGSPAETAGLRTGDFILAMNDRRFDEYRDVAKFLRDLRPGDRVAMLVERGPSRERLSLDLVATTPPSQIAAAR